MATVDSIRDSLISKLLTIRDRDILSALDKLLSSSVKDNKVELTEEQILMLKMSEEDVEKGHVIPQEKLFERERQWLNEQ